MKLIICRQVLSGSLPVVFCGALRLLLVMWFLWLWISIVTSQWLWVVVPSIQSKSVMCNNILQEVDHTTRGQKPGLETGGLWLPSKLVVSEGLTRLNYALYAENQCRIWTRNQCLFISSYRKSGPHSPTISEFSKNLWNPFASELRVGVLRSCAKAAPHRTLIKETLFFDPVKYVTHMPKLIRQVLPLW